MAHAFAMARAENIPVTELAGFAKGIATLLPSVIDEHSTRLEHGRHDGAHASVASAAAGMHHVIATTAARGIDASVLRAAHAVAARAIEAGHGTDGLSGLTVELERTAGS